MIQYYYMGYPSRDSRGGSRGGGRDFGGRSFGGEKRFRPVELHKAVCSTCGKDCEVPFKPTGDKPVYCRDCFAKNRSHDGERSFGGNNRDDRRAPRPEFKRFNEDRPTQAPRNNELEAINSKLDQILKLLNPSPVASEPTEIISKPEEVVAEVEVPVKKKRVSKKAVEIVEETPAE